MDILQQIEIAVGLKFGFAFVFGNLILVTGIKPNDIRFQRFDGGISVMPDGGIQYRTAKFVAIGRDIGPPPARPIRKGARERNCSSDPFANTVQKLQITDT